MKIACVYKTGGDFDSDYVEALYDSLSQYGDFLCFTDGDVPDYVPQVKLKHGWKGWWSKIEALGYDDDILLFDLDTVVVGDIWRMVNIAKATRSSLIMLSDFYYPEKPASGILYASNQIGNALYDKFVMSPELHMSKHRGDQDFITVQWKDIVRWDELLGDDYICSYKAHIAKTAPKHMRIKKVDPTKSKIVAFHGKPRPKDVKEFWNAD